MNVRVDPIVYSPNYIFNEQDFTTPEEVSLGGDGVAINLDQFIKKSGDVMSGSLHIPTMSTAQITFSDSTTQSTAPPTLTNFTNLQATVTDLSNKLTDVTYQSDITTINNNLSVKNGFSNLVPQFSVINNSVNSNAELGIICSSTSANPYNPIISLGDAVILSIKKDANNVNTLNNSAPIVLTGYGNSQAGLRLSTTSTGTTSLFSGSFEVNCNLNMTNKQITNTNRVTTTNLTCSGTATIGTGNITTSNITTATITTGNINTSNINTATITTGNIGTSNITTATIGTGNISTSSITTATINTANIGTLYLNTVNVASRLNEITNLQTRVGKGTMSLNYTNDKVNFRTAELSYLDATYLRTLLNGFRAKVAGLFRFSFSWNTEIQISLGGYEDITRFNYTDTTATYLTLANLYSLTVDGGANFNNEFDNHLDNPKVRYRNIKDANGNFSWDLTTKYNDDGLQRRGNGCFVTFTVYLAVNEVFYVQFKAGNNVMKLANARWCYEYLAE